MNVRVATPLQTLVGCAAVLFLLGSAVFVYRSFYGMRIRTGG